jgi:hypothetical protein
LTPASIFWLGCDMARRTVGERTAEQAAEDERYYTELRRGLNKIRPQHTLKFGQWTRPWYIAQQIAFAKALRASGDYARDAVLPTPAKSTAPDRSREARQVELVNAP